MLGRYDKKLIVTYEISEDYKSNPERYAAVEDMMTKCKNNNGRIEELVSADENHSYANGVKAVVNFLIMTGALKSGTVQYFDIGEEPKDMPNNCKNETLEKGLIVGGAIAQLELEGKLTFTADYDTDGEMLELAEQLISEFNSEKGKEYNYFVSFVNARLLELEAENTANNK